MTLGTAKCLMDFSRPETAAGKRRPASFVGNDFSPSNNTQFFTPLEK